MDTGKLDTRRLNWMDEAMALIEDAIEEDEHGADSDRERADAFLTSAIKRLQKALDDEGE